MIWMNVFFLEWRINQSETRLSLREHFFLKIARVWVKIVNPCCMVPAIVFIYRLIKMRLHVSIISTPTFLLEIEHLMALAALESTSGRKLGDTLWYLRLFSVCLLYLYFEREEKVKNLQSELWRYLFSKKTYYS